MYDQGAGYLYECISMTIFAVIQSPGVTGDWTHKLKFLQQTFVLV